MAVSSGNKSDWMKVSLWIVGNVSSSVGLILTNKIIMGPSFNFTYVFTLTSIHFFVTVLTMEIMAVAKLFSRSDLKRPTSILMSMACALSIGLMNLSLRINNLGFYQLCKLLGIPWLVFVQTTVYHKQTSCLLKTSLLIILVGIGIATMKYVQLSLIGCVVGFAAVVITIQFQIWQEQKQQEYQLNALQINHAQALPTFLVCTILAVFIEFTGVDETTNILSHTWIFTEIKWIFFSAMLAACVNLCSYGLIGHTSTITFQVVGHAKTVLILTANYYLFDESTKVRWNNVLGVIIALCGTVFYAYLRYNETSDQNLHVLFSRARLKKLFRCSMDQSDTIKEHSVTLKS